MPEDTASAKAEPGTLPALLAPDVAAAALAFLTRPGMGATIHAAEVDAFLRVRVALESLALKRME